MLVVNAVQMRNRQDVKSIRLNWGPRLETDAFPDTVLAVTMPTSNTRHGEGQSLEIRQWNEGCLITICCRLSLQGIFMMLVGLILQPCSDDY